jgi:hypothetical protein
VSDISTQVIPLSLGLDLVTPNLLARPGAMLSCLNYEMTDIQGYSRISGFLRYDGNITLKDIPNKQAYTTEVTTLAGSPALVISEEFIEDPDGNLVGYIVSGGRILPSNNAQITYVSFTGTTIPEGTVGTWSFKAPAASQVEATITQAQLTALETSLRGLVEPLPAPAVGLHWFRDQLYAVVPMLMIPYTASASNEVVGYEILDTLTTTVSGATATLLDKVVVTPASVGVQESGYFVVKDLDTGSWAGDGVATLGGAVSVGSGNIIHDVDELSDITSTSASFWVAKRPPVLREDKTPQTPGWAELPYTYSLTVTLSGVTTEFNAVVRGDSVSSSTYYFESGANSLSAVVLDYYVIDGSFEDGDAVVALQIRQPVVNAGASILDITTAYDMYLESSTTTKLGDVTTRMSFNRLPGYPELAEVSSRYEMKSINFYADPDRDAIYGVNGVGRSFTLSGGYLSFIYTQADATLDNPRHIEAHALHLALGFKRGSVQISVAGQPTNFSGLEGASELGIGDYITGLLALSGTTLGVFCEQSIWGILGTTVDNFQTQVIAPNTGCIEYTLADCGQPVYLDNRGVATLATSERYGDFVGQRLSSPVSPWLVPRCRRGLTGYNNTAGIACAIPVRSKNQYRVFFNDGEILTMTFLSGGEVDVGFTQQNYGLVPLAWTSEVDFEGTERIFVSHYNPESTFTSSYVYGLEQGDSFDGAYIPHSFETNWFFGDSPFQYSTLHAIRMYGLSRGKAGINVQVVGAQNDFDFSGAEYSTTATAINLPRTAGNIYENYKPVTNRTDISGRGLAVKLKFSGSNTDLAVAEPSHVCQVLLTYATPTGAFDL